MMDLIHKQPLLQVKRKFYSEEEKRKIKNYVQRFNVKATKPGVKIFNPSTEEYVHDMAILLDHIFSYEFNTFN